MKRNIFSKVWGLFFAAGALALASCEDNDDYKSLDTLALTLNDQIPDTAFFGQTLKVNLIANKANTFTLTLSPEDKPTEVVYDSVFTNTGGKFLFTGEVEVPANGSWTGAYLIKVAAGNVEDTKKVYFKKAAINNYYLVGGSSAAGWTPEKGIKLVYNSKVDNGVKTEWYDTFGYFTQAGDGLKLLPTNTGWDGDIGLDKNAAGKVTASNEGNFEVPADDFYRLRVTLNKGAIEGGTYVLTPSRWGVIGDATPGGWDADTDMSFTPGKGKYEWTATLPLEGGKQFKFRENDAWAVNLGRAGSDNKLKLDGENIVVPSSGSYTLTLNLDPAGYTYTMKKN